MIGLTSDWVQHCADVLNATVVYGPVRSKKISKERIATKEAKEIAKTMFGEQMLADAASLIHKLKNEDEKFRHSPVIAVGAGEGGRLAALMRIKYPSLVVGALASSAPLFWSIRSHDKEKHDQLVAKMAANYSPNCSLNVLRIRKTIENMYNFEGGGEKLDLIFNLCKPVTQLKVFHYLATRPLYMMALFDYSNPINWPQFPSNFTLGYFCNHPFNKHPDSFSDEELVSILAGNKNGTKDPNYCRHPNDLLESDLVEFIVLREIRDMFSGMEPQKFGFELDGRDFRWLDSTFNCREWCTNLGPRVRGPEAGQNVSLDGASNIIFSYGTRDLKLDFIPQKSIEERSIHAIRINDTAFAEDMHEPNSPKLFEVRQKELKIIQNWINEYNKENLFDLSGLILPNDDYNNDDDDE